MDANIVNIQIPTDLYDKLKSLAVDAQVDPVQVLDDLVSGAHQRRAWLRDLAALRQQIVVDGGLQVGRTRDEVIEKLRQVRSEIFEAEYAHLYR